MNDLIPVIVGFFLTSVLGGALGFFFQRRSWTHQHRVQLAEQERQQAVRIFEEVSRIMDKRLYRMRLLHWSLTANHDRDPESGSRNIEARMEDYRQSLYEWNDNVNRNLALVQQYFGVEYRNRLDRNVGATFVAIGREIEELWKARNSPGPERAPSRMNQRIGELSTLIYILNVDMIRAVQSGEIGWSVSKSQTSTRRP